MGRNRRRLALDEPSCRAHARDEDDAPREAADSREKMVIRVRRGALRRFDQLKARSAGLPVEIEWDRRVAERRSREEFSGAERRAGDQRRPPPFTWDAADFVVVGDTSSSPPPQDPTDPPSRKNDS